LVDHDSPLQFNPDLHGPILNVGVWGSGPLSHPEFVAMNRRLERKVNELKGRKWLYAHAYYPEDEFWSIYDKTWYDKLRRKYHATTLPSVYEKTRVKDQPVISISGRRGVWQAIIGAKKPV
jgi:hypothetical protein